MGKPLAPRRRVVMPLETVIAVGLATHRTSWIISRAVTTLSNEYYHVAQLNGTLPTKLDRFIPTKRISISCLSMLNRMTKGVYGGMARSGRKA